MRRAGMPDLHQGRQIKKKRPGKQPQNAQSPGRPPMNDQELADYNMAKALQSRFNAEATSKAIRRPPADGGTPQPGPSRAMRRPPADVGTPQPGPSKAMRRQSPCPQDVEDAPCPRVPSPPKTERKVLPQKVPLQNIVDVASVGVDEEGVPMYQFPTMEQLNEIQPTNRTQFMERQQMPKSYWEKPKGIRGGTWTTALHEYGILPPEGYKRK